MPLLTFVDLNSTSAYVGVCEGAAAADSGSPLGAETRDESGVETEQSRESESREEQILEWESEEEQSLEC